ncbi:MAG TPA: hypothetical protein VGO40_03365, partial [Longimicrobium sp.]|nr:hypothetical protein [Longimicrobium sp.]
TVDEYGPGHCHHKCASCCIQICNDLPHGHHLPDGLSGTAVDLNAGDALTLGTPQGGPDGPG